ncbi:MAG: pyruvate synthase, partial [Chloroflexi bacterium]|nr:pyruvate synthase [Chloroflexota bacterium]
LAIETGIWVQYEIIDGELTLNGPSRSIAKGIRKRKPVEDYLMRQGRFAHFTPEDIKYFQGKVDETWEKWWLPGVIPISASKEE